MRPSLATPAWRKVLFTVLYVSEGAPMGYIWWALPTKLEVAGLEIGEITALTSVLTLPWALKVAWAPLIDVLSGPRWTLRAWIITAQLGMALTLLPLLRLDLAVDFDVIYALLVCHAVLAATQDVAVDTLAISVTPPAERGSVNGWMQVGLLAGRAVFGGGILILESRFGEQVSLGVLLGVLAVSLALLLLTDRLLPLATEAWRGRLVGLAATLRRAVARSRTWVALLFAGTAGAAYEAVGAVAGPFLIHHGYSKEDVGRFYLPVAVVMSLGALAGGRLSDRLGRRRSVAGALLLVVLVVLLLAAADAALPAAGVEAEGGGGVDPGGLRFALLTTLYLAIGLFTASTYALFMDLTEPAVAATQFAAFMAMTNVCEFWSSRLAGWLIGSAGFAAGFAVVAALSLLTLPLLAFLAPPGHRTPSK